jgi:hypothetical protein
VTGLGQASRHWGRRDWVVAVGVEWAERSEPAHAHADTWPGRRGPRGAADLATDRGGLPAADEVVGRGALVVLTDPERRIGEYRRYLAIVHRAVGTARGTDPPGTVNLPGADDTAGPSARDTPASTRAEAVPASGGTSPEGDDGARRTER